MGLVRNTVDRWLGRVPTRSITLDELQWFLYNGMQYPVMPGASGNRKQEEPAPTFEGYVQAAFKANGVVFGCLVARMLLFAEARFQFRQMRNGRPGDLFGTQALDVLENPWPNGTTGDLLSRMIQDSDLAGNFYAARRGAEVLRMRPDWVTIVMGSELAPDEPALALDAEVIGYVYEPRGPRGGADPVFLRPEEVCHFAPIPDPVARYRGMSWLTPVVREIMGDNAATDHKLHYFEQGATPSLAVVADPAYDVERFKEFIQLFKAEHSDVMKAWKTFFLGGGADVKVVGSNLEQVDFKATQGAGETRICVAARVPPIIVGVSEGLASATYSNYGEARRAFADLTMRPLWRNASASLASIVDVPSDAELWFDDRDIAFLQEDQKDAAEILEIDSRAIKGLVEAGFEPDAVVDAVASGDLRRLKHTGMLSVQMQTPGESAEPSTNGAVPQPIGATDE